jgi:CRISPR-associated protein (TIGR02584 family)
MENHTTGKTKSPNEYRKRVLLCSVGIYPQVVTETLYALVKEKGFIPTHVHVIGTAGVEEAVVSTLLHPRVGQFHALCRNLGIEGQVTFNKSCIHVITDKNGRPLSDIRTQEDNMATANAIVDIVRKECQDDTSCIHVSIAGGQKSLSFFLGYILSIFAQPQDTLSHVLVSPEYENLPEFFYPTQEQQELRVIDYHTFDERVILAKNAKATLADIPFIRLRNNLPDNFLREGPYSELIDYLDSALDPIEMRFDLKKKTVICDAKSIVSSNESVKLPPIPLSTLLWLAVRKKNGLDAIDPSDDAAALEYFAFAQDIEIYIPGMHSSDLEKKTEFDNALKSFKAKFTEAVSRANNAIRKVLPEIERYRRFEIGSEKPKKNGRSRNSLYQLVTPSENIVLPDEIKDITLRQFVFPKG